jgi:hypothetical protein
MDDLLSRLTPEQAREVLRRLCEKDGAIRDAAVAEARAMLADVDVDDVARDVFDALDSIDVHDLWDRAGPKRDGYVPPGEMAFEMVEEEIEPFLDQARRYRELGMNSEEDLVVMGVLKGLYCYAQESKSEFKDWAADIPGECFGDVLRLLRKEHKNKTLLKKMNQFIEVACPTWSKWHVKG